MISNLIYDMVANVNKFLNYWILMELPVKSGDHYLVEAKLCND